ncbi:MAG: TetR family transcriptional regulator [Oscillochloridaceae bacterium umkhey_bin13]
MQARAHFTVEAILDAALRVFERHGYAATRSHKVAMRARFASSCGSGLWRQSGWSGSDQATTSFNRSANANTRRDPLI